MVEILTEEFNNNNDISIIAPREVIKDVLFNSYLVESIFNIDITIDDNILLLDKFKTQGRPVITIGRALMANGQAVEINGEKIFISKDCYDTFKRLEQKITDNEDRVIIV